MSCCNDKQAIETLQQYNKSVSQEVAAIMQKLDNLEDDKARVFLKLELVAVLQLLKNIEEKQPCQQ